MVKSEFLELLQQMDDAKKSRDNEAERLRQEAKLQQRTKQSNKKQTKGDRLSNLPELDSKDQQNFGIQFKKYNPDKDYTIDDNWDAHIDLLKKVRKFVKKYPAYKQGYFQKLYDKEAVIQAEIDRQAHAEEWEETLDKLTTSRDKIKRVRDLVVPLQALHNMLRENGDPWTLESKFYIGGKKDPSKNKANRAMIIYYLEERWFSDEFVNLKVEFDNLKVIRSEADSKKRQKVENAFWLKWNKLRLATHEQLEKIMNDILDLYEHPVPDAPQEREGDAKERAEYATLMAKIDALDTFNLRSNLRKIEIGQDKDETVENLKRNFYLYKLLYQIETSKKNDIPYVKDLFVILNGSSLEDVLSPPAGETKQSAEPGAVPLTRAALEDWMTQFTPDSGGNLFNIRF